jgi:ELWxxDGT repeat protein
MYRIVTAACERNGVPAQQPYNNARNPSSIHYMRPSLLLLSLSVSLSLYAQSPYLVKDINTTVGNPVSSMPHDFAAIGNRTLFAASTPSTGDELWVTDGTSGGTSLLADIIPGTPESRPIALVALNGAVLFFADDGVHGSELWTSDGTAAGTHLVLDINPAAGSSRGGSVVYNNRIYFGADDGSHGYELWTSDGTAAGTRMVKDLNPGTASGSPGSLTVFNGSLYFGAFNGFWKSNGTDAGTVKIADARAYVITVAGSRLYLGGITPEAGAETWISDGTSAGTHMIVDLRPGTDSSLFRPEYTPLGNKVLFVATDGVHGYEMWVTDGTAAGTQMIRDFVPGSHGMFDSLASYLTVFNGRAFFAASDTDHGRELWTTDGTDTGTALFDDVTPGSLGSGPTDLVVVDGKLFFVANPPSLTSFSLSRRLWVSDGTVAGTRMSGGVDGPGVTFVPSLRTLWPAGGKLYFAGTDLLNGAEPWVATGSDDVHMIANLAADAAPSSSPSSLTATDNLLFFYARERGSEYSLWRSDGTASGTFKLLETGHDDDPFMRAGPVVLFDHTSGNTVQNFVSDGTVDGTQSSQFFMYRFGGGRAASVFPHGSTLFANVVHNNDFSTSGLWAASSAPSGTGVLLGAGASSLIDFAGHVAFLGDGGFALSTSDGTPAGTHRIASLPFSGERSAVVNAEGTLYFLEVVGPQQRQLWKSDGTADGTTLVIEPVTHGISYIPTIKAAGRKVYFVTGGSLWVSDGTAAGTVELVPLTVFSDDTNPLKATGDHVVWTTWTQNGGAVLWTSDGTKEGTKQLLTGDPGLMPLTEIDGTVFFGHADANHGSEIWITDGTAEGTKLYVDLNPGPAGSFPAQFTKIGNLLYVAATNAATGTELWAVPFTDPAISISDARVTEGDSGTAVAHFAVSMSNPATQNVTLSYATSGGTAVAGQDYDATSGTITFAPGETSKTIDVIVRGDVASENNETFFVTVSNVNGAKVIRGEAVAIIEDDDQFADLGVSPKFTPLGGFGLTDSAVVANSGPRTATDVNVTITSTPANARSVCTLCAIQQIASGATSATEANSRWPGYQTYVSAIAAARQRDPQLANNSAAWTVSGDGLLAMNAAYLTVGQTATLTFRPFGPGSSLVSSDPLVVSVPPAVTTGNTATVTANKAGTSSITFTSSQQQPLQITVVDTGTQMRWPGGVTIEPDFNEAPFGRTDVRIAATGTAPLTGAKATGTVVVTAAGQELGRQQVNGNSFTMPVYLPKLGTMPWVVSYSGDTNFLPQTVSRTITVSAGSVAITGALQRTATAGTYLLRVLVNGSPVSAPSGTLSIRNAGTEIAQIPLVASTGGTSIAQTTLTNLPSSVTLTVNYPGDSFYRSATQQIRVVESHQRTVR